MSRRALTVWEEIAAEAAAESALWEQALRPAGERGEEPAFSPLGESRFALAVESIYEGYLLHYGRPRLFAPEDAGTSVLLGDYLYAHGLVRLSAHGEASAVADMAELISLCTQLRAGAAGVAGRDGHAWAATVALLGAADGRLEEARALLRLEGDSAPLAALAEESAGAEAVGRALAVHAALVE